MNTKHILLTSALVVSALAFKSCEDFFDTSSKKDLNTETAYSNLESAEMALVGCYDGWQRTISDEGVGMYLLAEFASEQAFAGLGLSDAKNNNVSSIWGSLLHTMISLMWIGRTIIKLYSVVISSLFRKIISTGQGTSRHKDE